MSDFLEVLSAEENAARLARKQAVDNAVQEYLLYRLKRDLDPSLPPLTVPQVAKKYRVTKGLIEHRIYALRQLQAESEEPEDEPIAVPGLGDLFTGLARAQRERLDATENQSRSSDYGS